MTDSPRASYSKHETSSYQYELIERRSTLYSAVLNLGQAVKGSFERINAAELLARTSTAQFAPTQQPAVKTNTRENYESNSPSADVNTKNTATVLEAKDHASVSYQSDEELVEYGGLTQAEFEKDAQREIEEALNNG